MYRKLFIAFNVLIVAAFAVAVYRTMTPEWKAYQRTYYRMAADAMEARASQVKDPKESRKLRQEAAKIRSTPLAIRQILTPFGTADRCVTCHVAMDEFANPPLTNNFKENPYKAHPDLSVINGHHKMRPFGCTACHHGQGMATTVADAHGYVENWEDPMLPSPYIQASCARCHGNYEHLKGAEAAARGRKLFEQHGCVGCHAINGVGGVVSVDLGNIADKPLERILPYNFSLMRMPHFKKGEKIPAGPIASLPAALFKPLPKDRWILRNWILAHLVDDPQSIVPNDPLALVNPEPVAPSGMNDFRRELSYRDAQDITTWLLSQTHVDLPRKFYTPAPLQPKPVFKDEIALGKHVFDKYGCAGCHGMDAKKGRRIFNGMGPGQKPVNAVHGAELVKEMGKGREPTLIDTAGTYDLQGLISKIANGVPATAVVRYDPNGPVPPLYMPAWKDKISPKELQALAKWLLSVAKKPEGNF